MLRSSRVASECCVIHLLEISEAVTRRCSVKEVFVKILQNSHKNNCVDFDLGLTLPNTHEKTLDQQNTREKTFCNHEITTRKNFGPTKYHYLKFETHEKPLSKNLAPTKYPLEKILDPLNLGLFRRSMATWH